MRGFRLQSRYDITDDNVLSQSGAGDRSVLPSRISWWVLGDRRTEMVRESTSLRPVCSDYIYCSYVSSFLYLSSERRHHLGHHEGRVAQDVGGHQQGGDSRQISLLITDTNKERATLRADYTLRHNFLSLKVKPNDHLGLHQTSFRATIKSNNNVSVPALRL